MELIFSAKRNRANNLELGIPRIVTTPTKETEATTPEKMNKQPQQLTGLASLKSTAERKKTEAENDAEEVKKSDYFSAPLVDMYIRNHIHTWPCVLSFRKKQQFY